MMLGWCGSRRGLRCAVVLAGLLSAAAATAQTPLAACGADSLYLFSPASLQTVLVSQGRGGLRLSWPDLDREQATCVSITDTAGLGFGVAATGAFGDRVDRQLLFTVAGDGTVGGVNQGNLLVNWITEGSSSYGRLAGVLNLANNGGIWNWGAGAAAWSQTNAGLPATWRQVNVTALAKGTGGFRLASFTRGADFAADPAGLYRYADGAWQRVAPEIFDGSTTVTALAVSPAGNDRFAVGTDTRGVYVTTDGGQSFTQWAGNLDPAAPARSTYGVTALEWTSTRLVAALPQFGVFYSTDGGAAWTVSPFRVPSTLDPAAVVTQDVPTVNDLAVDPANPDRLLAALLFHGCYETTDGGASWHNLYGDLNVAVPGSPGAWSKSGQGVVVLPGSSTLVMGVVQDGLYRSANGGANWTKVALEPGVQPASVNLQKFALAAVPGVAGAVAAFEDNHGLIRSDDDGASWYRAATQAPLVRGVALLPGDQTGALVLGSWGGGIYTPGTSLLLSDTYSSDTSSGLRSLALGLSISFTAGTAHARDVFRVKAQTFQGWAVWRSVASAPDQMTMIGLFDRVNPEDCIRGFCGDESYEVIPRCFASKRAACFDLSTPDTVRFFDDQTYNGFDYFYAVSAFDYGNTALSTPENNSAELLFSPRWLGDAGSVFRGQGNRVFVNINAPAAPAVGGDEIYAFPNPVRAGAGFPGSEGDRVAFTNLPPGSRVRVFTVAGDDVNNLGPDSQVGGQIYWETDNRDGEDVAPGVYLYKVEMPQREPYWGRIVIIR